MAQQDKVNIEETVETVEQEETKGGFDQLFSAGESKGSFSGVNQLSKTQQLTNIATEISQHILSIVADAWDEYEGQVKASQKSHDAMDDLVNEVHDLGSVDVDFLKSVSDEEIDKMIRSQQSKRSRSKSKAMTKENYQTMMVGAIAENLLRIAGNKPKSSGGGAVMGEIGFSAEDLEKLAEFPEELTKAIRNVQSKKSIMKSKADFDVQSPRWQQLLRAEQQLKDVRDRNKGVVAKEAQEAIEVKKKVEELLSTEDLNDMSPDEAKDLLNKAREMLLSK